MELGARMWRDARLELVAKLRAEGRIFEANMYARHLDRMEERPVRIPDEIRREWEPIRRKYFPETPGH
ncbi:MAG: hypothetical protein QM648_01645 [Solirubrobacterales bacterium]